MKRLQQMLKPVGVTILLGLVGLAIGALAGCNAEDGSLKASDTMTVNEPSRNAVIHDEREKIRHAALKNQLTIFENGTNVRLHNMEEILKRLDRRTRVLGGEQ